MPMHEGQFLCDQDHPLIVDTSLKAAAENVGVFGEYSWTVADCLLFILFFLLYSSILFSLHD